MGLFNREPIWRKDFSVYRIDKGHRERNKAIQYVRDKVNDDATLSRIILEAPDNEVKRTAIEKLADPSVLSASVYFSVHAPYLKDAMLKKITDRETLLEIALQDKDKPHTRNDEEAQKRRAEALRKIDDAETAKRFLEDDSWRVREEAFRQATDFDVIVRYLASGKQVNMEILRGKLRAFSAEQMRSLDGTPGLRWEVKGAICEVAGHKRDVKCRCVRCGKALGHAFNADDVCEHCGGKRLVYREDVGETEGGKRYVYGYRDVVSIRYPDGTAEEFPEPPVITDRGTYNWLYQD